MAYFHEKWVRSRGGRKSRPMIKVVAQTIDELLSLNRAHPDVTTISLPRRAKDAYKSKSLPQLWIDVDSRDVLDEIESTEVDENYVRVLTWLLREDFFRTRCSAYVDDAVEKFFRQEIRGNLIRLLRAGSWVDSPSSLGLEKLNHWLEKIDLGRRSDLNFSSRVPEIQKYDQDFTSEGRLKSAESVKGEDEPNADVQDNEYLYRNGTKEDRERILDECPWLRKPYTAQFGEP